MLCCIVVLFFFFQAEDGIRDAQESRGLGDVYKRQSYLYHVAKGRGHSIINGKRFDWSERDIFCVPSWACLLYTSDAADDLLCVDLGGRRIIKKKNYS